MAQLKLIIFSTIPVKTVVNIDWKGHSYLQKMSSNNFLVNGNPIIFEKINISCQANRNVPYSSHGSYLVKTENILHFLDELNKKLEPALEKSTRSKLVINATHWTQEH